MKKTILILPLVLFTLASVAQTRKIAFKSHSGNMANYSPTMNDDFGIPYHKEKYEPFYNVAPATKPKSDSNVIYETPEEKKSKSKIVYQKPKKNVAKQLDSDTTRRSNLP